MNYIRLTDDYFRQLVYSVSINPQTIIENKTVQYSSYMTPELLFSFVSEYDLNYPLVHSLKINEIVYSIDTNKITLKDVIENLKLLYLKHWKTNLYPIKEYFVGVNNCTKDKYLNKKSTLDNIEILIIPDGVIKQGIENYNLGLYFNSKNKTEIYLNRFLNGFDYNEALYNAVKTEHYIYYLGKRLDIWIKLLDKVKLLFSETSTNPIIEKKELGNIQIEKRLRSINDIKNIENETKKYISENCLNQFESKENYEIFKMYKENFIIDSYADYSFLYRKLEIDNRIKLKPKKYIDWLLEKYDIDLRYEKLKTLSNCTSLKKEQNYSFCVKTIKKPKD